MKKLFVIFFSLGVTLSVTAQPKVGSFHGGYGGGIHGSYSGGVHYVRPRVTVVAPLYPSYGYGYGLGLGLGYGLGYSPFNSPFYSQRIVEARPSQLDLEIEDIKNEYDYKVSTAKHDDSLSKDERKQKVRDLKHEKDEAIIDAKKNYYAAKDAKRAENDAKRTENNSAL